MIDEIIIDVLDCNHIKSIPIEKFSKDELIELAEKVKEYDLLVTISAEYSNFHQGVLVNIVKKSLANQLLKSL